MHAGQNTFVAFLIVARSLCREEARQQPNMTRSEFSGSASGKHRTVCFFFYRLYSSAEVYYKTHTHKLFGHQFKKHFLDQLKKTMLEIQRFYWSMINYFSKLRLTTTKNGSSTWVLDISKWTEKHQHFLIERAFQLALKNWKFCHAFDR